MKIKMFKLHKIIIISALSLIVIILIFLQYKESKNFSIVEKEDSVYTYSAKTDIEYTVNLIHNSIYDAASLPQGGSYISAFVNSININFNHLLKGDKIARIYGRYNVVGTVKCNIPGEEKPTTLWSKDFKLVPYTTFSSEDISKQITQNIKLDYNFYNNLSKEINEITNLSTYNIIDLTMNVEYTIKNNDRTTIEKFNPTVSIPLNVNYFSITTLNADVKNGDVKETSTTTVPPNNMLLIIYRILIGIILLLILLSIFLTAVPTEYDIYIKSINKVFKNYGKLLIGIHNPIYSPNENTYYIKSIEDLIKISDELEKPIFYNTNESISEINEFYILDRENIYVYIINMQNTKNKDYLFN